MEIIGKGKVYDVCVIGSGAAGGAAAKVLTEGGLDVVMLEAGPMLHPETDFKEHVWPYELAHRGAGIGGAGYTDFGSTELTGAERFLDDRGRALHQRPRLQVPLVSLAHCGRPDESLGTHCSPVCRGGFPCALRGRSR